MRTTIRRPRPNWPCSATSPGIGGSAFGSVLAPPLSAWIAGSFGRRGVFLTNFVTGPVVDAHRFTPIFIATAMLYPRALVVLRTIPRTIGHSEDSHLQEG